MINVREIIYLLLVFLSTVPGRDRKTMDRSEPPSGSMMTENGDAGRDGLEQAERDVASLKKGFASKSPEELIGSLIPDAEPHQYGGYAYYYRYMANLAIREELRSRGSAAASALQHHSHDEKRLLEAINGPGSTVATLCAELLRLLPESGTNPIDIGQYHSK